MSEKVAGIYIFCAVVSEDLHNQVVTASNLHVWIRPSLSKFQLILAQCYQYISFLNTPINLAIMVEQMSFQLTICLPFSRMPLTHSSKAFPCDPSFSKAPPILEQSSQAAIWTATVSVVGRGLDILCWKQRKISCSVVNGRPLALEGRRQRMGVSF